MATIAENKKVWDGQYQWTGKGNEWSASWGSVSMQWYGSIMPRIYNHLPAENIVEIACGYGRWTAFLKDNCISLVLVDLSRECIEACMERFRDESHIQYHVNDGKSLAMIADESADFVFSFDSLVHADPDVMKAYISQLPRILKKDGVAFLHHSNLGEYRLHHDRINRIPGLRRLLILAGIMDSKLHWRDPDVSAELVEEICGSHNLACISQEIVPWGTKKTFIDCFSTIVRDDSSLVRDNRKMRNPHFMQEAAGLRKLSLLYFGK